MIGAAIFVLLLLAIAAYALMKNKLGITPEHVDTESKTERSTDRFKDGNLKVNQDINLDFSPESPEHMMNASRDSTANLNAKEETVESNLTEVKVKKSNGLFGSQKKKDTNFELPRLSELSQ